MQHHAQLQDRFHHHQNGSRGLLPGTHQFSLNLDQPLPREVQLIALAPSLERAVPRRQTQFRAGRYCAMKALEALVPQLANRPIDRTANGAPVWPQGLTGSITHTDDFASAAVASTTTTVSLGIDTERVMSDQQARDVGDLIASSIELQHCHAAGIGPLEALTLVFSAKESVFKCLHPLVGRMFEFDDVRIVGIGASVDAGVRTFRAEIVKTLSTAFSEGTLLEGRFLIENLRIHTGMSIEVPAARRSPESQVSVQAR